MRINKDSLCKGRNNLVKPEFKELVFSQYLKIRIATLNWDYPF